MVSKSHDYIDWNDLALGPGGYRPRKLFHRVEQGKALRIAQWGSAQIVSRTTVASDAGSSGEVIQNPEKLFLTPGGYRHPFLIRHLESGQGIQVTDNGVNIVENERKGIIEELTIIGRSEYLPAIGGDWIANAYWKNDTGNPISLFTSTWKVPEAPLTNSGQVIYVFNGMQYVHPVGPGMVLPVLQWGDAEASGSEKWSIASWYLDPSGIAVSSTVVPVNAGDTLVGAITLLNHSDGMFTYKVEFQGITGTSLVVPDILELQACYEVLEAYDIRHCSDYPHTPHTYFQNITIQTGNIAPLLNWSTENRVAICGQQAVVLSNSHPASEIIIYYS